MSLIEKDNELRTEKQLKNISITIERRQLYEI
jgi:hypothetical protein